MRSLFAWFLLASSWRLGDHGKPLRVPSCTLSAAAVPNATLDSAQSADQSVTNCHQRMPLEDTSSPSSRQHMDECFASMPRISTLRSGGFPRLMLTRWLKWTFVFPLERRANRCAYPTASAILMQTENATVGTVINSQQVAELPLEWAILRAAGPAYAGSEPRHAGQHHGPPRCAERLDRRVGMSANGARDTQNRFYYDGIEAMDLDSYSFSFSPSIDAINEFKVQAAPIRPKWADRPAVRST